MGWLNFIQWRKIEIEVKKLDTSDLTTLMDDFAKRERCKTFENETLYANKQREVSKSHFGNRARIIALNIYLYLLKKPMTKFK